MPYPGFDENDRFIGTREEELQYYQDFKLRNGFPHPIDYMKWELLTYGSNLQPLTRYLDDEARLLAASILEGEGNEPDEQHPNKETN